MGMARMGKSLGKVAGVAVIALLVAVAVVVNNTVKTIADLLKENRELREAISRLTTEDTIGYAKIESQREENGKIFTTVRFVETERGNPHKRLFAKSFEVEGDILHFDALTVKFDNRYVQDGRERALYLWRRIYGEFDTPSAARNIDTPGEAPERYRDFAAALRLRDQRVFWDAIWDLSNDPDRLQSLGVQAIHGSVAYRQLRPGVIYSFKISNTGQLISDIAAPEL